MSPSTKTIIFFPIDSGLAHIIRCLAIAERLAESGHRVLFALPKSKQNLTNGKTLKVLDTGEFFPDGEDTDKLKDPKYSYPFVLEELAILKKYKPDLAIIDYRFSAIVACKKANIPIVLITNSEGLPPDIYLPNFNLPNFIQAIINPIFQKTIWSFKSHYLNSFLKVGEMLGISLDLYKFYDGTIIVPEPPSYLPSNSLPDIHYVGYIEWGFKNNYPVWLRSINPDGKTIYLTFGGTGYDPKKLVTLSQTLVNKGYRVIVSSSNIADSKDFKKDKNLFVEKFLPGLEVCKRVDLVICHGGVGTLFQALKAEKPMIAIPFNPDQYIHAFRFQELGLGRVVTNADISQLLNINWKKFLNLGKSVPLEKIIKTIDQVIERKDEFSKALKFYREKFTKEDGVKNAVEVIENVLK